MYRSGVYPPEPSDSILVGLLMQSSALVSEATVYRLLKDHGLIISPAFILMKAADRFANPTTAPNQLWQTDLDRKSTRLNSSH